MCPPRRPFSRTGRSRLTPAPVLSVPRLERSRVSPMTSALNSPSCEPVTVRQTPLMAIESPRAASAVTSGPRILIRAASPVISMPTTSPSSSTIPVNTVSSSGAAVLHGLRGALTAQTRHDRYELATAPARALTAHVLPPIRTLTVGPGIPPGQPADGFGRVADYHRRFGVSPTPEHAYLRELVCHAGYSGASHPAPLGHAWRGAPRRESTSTAAATSSTAATTTSIH